MNFSLLALLILVILMNVPLLLNRTHLFWDSYNAYEEFSIIYTGVSFHNQLPLWLPYASYGMPENASMGYLSIVSFLFIFLGKIFSIKDGLLLFSISLVGEQIISIGGMYLLSSRLFKKRLVHFVVCLATLVTFEVYRQLQFNFRLVYLLPLALFWIVLFFQRQRPEYLWIAGITFLFSVPGSAIYPLIIEFYALAIFFAILLLYNVGKIFILLKFSWRNLVSFLCMLLLAGLFLVYLKNVNQGIDFFRSGRSSDLSVPLLSYLTTWKYWTPLELMLSFVTGVVSKRISNIYEYVFYFGLLPFLGVVIACLYRRKPAFSATLGAGAFLYLFSLRGFFSAAVYYLPLVDLTRYIAILGTIPFRTFLILAAGFGLDLDLTLAQLKKTGVVFISLIFIFEIVALLAPHDGYYDILSQANLYSRDFKILLIRLGGYLGLLGVFWILQQPKQPRLPFALSWNRLFQIGVVLVIILDLALFRYNFEYKLNKEQVGMPRMTPAEGRITPLEYQDQRLKAPADGSTQELIQTITQLQAVTAYGMESFTHFDRCYPYYASIGSGFELISTSLAPLVENQITLNQDMSAPQSYDQIYACGYPKLRVVSNVLVPQSTQEAIQAVKEAQDLSNLLVLSKEYSQVETSLDHAKPEAEIRVTGFTENEIRISANLKTGDGGWLIYSDAYHPNWRATVNGKTVKIERAYLGFKAIHLDAGENNIKMMYGSPWFSFAYTALVIACALAALVAFAGFIYLLFIKVESTDSR